MAAEKPKSKGLADEEVVAHDCFAAEKVKDGGIAACVEASNEEEEELMVKVEEEGGREKVRPVSELVEEDFGMDPTKENAKLLPVAEDLVPMSTLVVAGTLGNRDMEEEGGTRLDGNWRPLLLVDGGIREKLFP